MAISPDDLISDLKKEGIDFDQETRSLKDKSFLNLTQDLKLDANLKFTYKEMKINNAFQYVFSCSLSKKIKANCNYKAVLFLNYEKHNENIGSEYAKIEQAIKSCIEEIKKGGLFNSEDRYESKINIISTDYKACLSNIKAIKNDYDMQVLDKPNYEFGCSVLKIENNYGSVKRADFNLGIESFVDIVQLGTEIENYKLGLIEDKNIAPDEDDDE